MVKVPEFTGLNAFVYALELRYPVPVVIVIVGLLILEVPSENDIVPLI